MNCAVTVCDANCTIIYMNNKSRNTFAEGSDRLIGANLLDCHPEHARRTIARLLHDGGVNVYTIEKHGVKKMIYQTAWRNDDGSVGGLVEISMQLPDDVPHFVRS
jgi:transcriptional regulator with PAS, ATPase and Fis domain